MGVVIASLGASVTNCEHLCNLFATASTGMSLFTMSPGDSKRGRCWRSGTSQVSTGSLLV